MSIRNTNNPKIPKEADFLARGYLPKELPFLFNTSAFASIAVDAYAAATKEDLKKWTNPLTIPVGAKGGRRRTAAIPNPLSQTRLVQVIVNSWQEIERHCNRSKISFSRLKFPGKERTLANERRGDPLHSYEGIWLTKQFSQKRLELAASSAHILRADIANFYGSIYTHSLSWALHGKVVGKKRSRDETLLGNRLDEAVRHGNDGQTKGIPIGPDTSRVLSEIIGVALDDRLTEKLKERVSQGHEGIRWVDDFLLYFQTAAERDKALGTLVEALEDFELALNHHKTANLLPGEDLIEAPWVHALRRYSFHTKPLVQFYDLLGFTDLVATLTKAHPGDSVALYASKILWSLHVAESNLPDLLTALWRMVHLDSRVVSVAAIYTATLSDKLLQKERIQMIARQVLVFHLSDFIERRWAIETTWLLWLCLRTGLSLPEKLCKSLEAFDHPLVALAAIEAERAGLTNKKLNTSEWSASVSEDQALTGSRWMLAYELRRSGVLKKAMKHSFFEFLAQHDVTFLKDQTRDPGTSK